ncbi:MAG TPA: glycosyltransferase family 2 protein [Bryobacteraceae bacterium]
MLIPTPAPCQIRLIELTGDVGPVTIDPARYRAVGLFFLAHGVPLGHRYLSAAELPLNTEQVWNVAVEAILPALTEYLVRAPSKGGSRVHELVAANALDSFGQMLRSRAGSANGRVSVIICTRERPDSLARCLFALSQFSDDSVEYIVVDNAPVTDATREVVAGYPNVRYYVEPRKGLSYARNTGIRRAQGDLLVFTDDDVIVTKHWLGELTRPFSDANVMCTTGLVLPAEMESDEQSLFEHWLSFSRGYLPARFDSAWLKRNRKKAAPVWRIGAGASMAIRRSAFGRVGYFDTRLGAGAAGCSEDSEFWYRLLQAGLVCEYAPAAFVLHHHRMDRAGLVSQMRLYARGHAAALLVQFFRSHETGNLTRLCGELPRVYLRKLGSSVIYPEWRRFWLATLWGHVAGMFYLVGRRKDRSAPMEAHGEPVALASGPGSHGQR